MLLDQVLQLFIGTKENASPVGLQIVLYRIQLILIFLNRGQHVITYIPYNPPHGHTHGMGLKSFGIHLAMPSDMFARVTTKERNKRILSLDNLLD